MGGGQRQVNPPLRLAHLLAGYGAHAVDHDQRPVRLPQGRQALHVRADPGRGIHVGDGY